MAPYCRMVYPLRVFNKNIDIDELCFAFTDNARCDGTKVVIDPQGVNSILEKVVSSTDKLIDVS